MAQYGFYFDQTICTGCKGCQIACADVNDSRAGYLFRNVSNHEGGAFPNVWVAELSMSCNHCAEPACVENCPTGSLVKNEENGLVLHDDSTCIGCGTCVNSCPYGAPVLLDERGVAGKCDGCTSNGYSAHTGSPACVAACPTRALKFGDVEGLKVTYGADLGAALSVLPDPSETSPSFIIKAKPEMR